MKRSAEALTSTMRVSRVNSTRPSCNVPMIWSRFSFRALKTSFTSRICRPRRSILVLTIPYSSVRRGSGSGVDRARRRSSGRDGGQSLPSGRRAMFDTPAANASETRIAMTEKISACRSCGSNFALQQNSGDADADIAEGLAFALDREIHVIDARLAEYRFELFAGRRHCAASGNPRAAAVRCRWHWYRCARWRGRSRR